MTYVFDLGRAETNADPFPEFARLREQDPVHWSPAMKAWIVTRYEDVRRIALNNREISADRLTPFFKTNAEYQRGGIESRCIRAAEDGAMLVNLALRQPAGLQRERGINDGVIMEINHAIIGKVAVEPVGRSRTEQEARINLHVIRCA